MSSRAPRSTPRRPVRTRPPGATSARDDGPRRVRHGLKLTHEPDDLRRHLAAAPWLAAVEAHLDPAVLEAGLEYARLGQVVEFEIAPGAVVARVQGTAPRPYDTVLRLAPLSADEWDRLITAMAGEAIYAARLPAGELPESVVDVAAGAGVPLRPDAATLESECTCAATGFCRHAAATALLVAGRLAEQPLLLFALRGMPADRVIDRLRQVRAIETRGVATAHADPLIEESQVPPPPLEANLEEFWRGGPRLAEVERAAPPEHAPHALLRRLGPSPMNGRFPMAGLLASIYDAVSERARRLRDGAGREDEERTSP